MPSMFISHSHDEKALADAIRAAMSKLVSTVNVQYSSDTSVGGGIQPGADWLTEIMKWVRGSEITLILLTSRSAAKAWLMWEAGAVSGVALGLGDHASVVPVLFRVPGNEIPGPLRSKQAIVGGHTEKGARRLFSTLIAKFVPEMLPESAIHAMVTSVLKDYLAAVDAAFADRPAALDEAALGEWLERINDMIREKRASELGHLQRAIEINFGGRQDAVAIPLDVRVHRRLGEAFLGTGESERAVEQFELARRLAPRDVFVLHKLGLAHLEAGNRTGAKRALEDGEALDSTLASWNAEFAGLKGRTYRDEWRQTGDKAALATARDAYQVVMLANPKDYYMADNVGQLSLLLGEIEVAKEAFGIAKIALADLREHSVWSLATSASVAIVLDENDDTAAAVLADVKQRANERQLTSVAAGLTRLAESVPNGAARKAGWLAALGK